jgi:putative IMPACT (imprinted ancient) family translation regulator
LLGAGGLVRAYGDAVSAAVSRASRVARRRVASLTVRAGHAEAGRLEHQLRHHVDELGGLLEDAAYDAVGAAFRVVVPAGAEVRLADVLASGGIEHDLTVRGLEVRDVPRR